MIHSVEMPFYILREAITTNTISMPAEQLVLLQQFIQLQDDHIVRVETIGGKVIYTMKVFTTSAFNPCPYLQMSKGYRPGRPGTGPVTSRLKGVSLAPSNPNPLETR